MNDALPRMIGPYATVIAATIQDAISTAPTALPYRAECREWLLTDSDDFHEACRNAGADPDQVRAYAAKRINDADAGNHAPVRKSIPLHPSAYVPLPNEAKTSWRQVNDERLKAKDRHARFIQLNKRKPEPIKQPKPIKQTKSRVHMIEWQGRTQSIRRWAHEIGIKYSTLVIRFRHGWSTERAFTTPPPRCLETFAESQRTGGPPSCDIGPKYRFRKWRF